MSTPTPSQAPSLTVTDEPTIGTPWLGLSAPMPQRTDNAQPSMQPFVDIYHAVRTAQAQLHEIREMLVELQIPWHHRLWRWIKSFGR